MRLGNIWTTPVLMYQYLCRVLWWINRDVHCRVRPERRFTHRSVTPNPCVSDWIVPWVLSIWYHLWNDWRHVWNVSYMYTLTLDYRMRWVDTMTHQMIWLSTMKFFARVDGWIWSVDVADRHPNTSLRFVKWPPSINHASYPTLAVLKCGCLDWKIW